MTTTSSESENPSISDDDSELNYIPGKYTPIETETSDSHGNGGIDENLDEDFHKEPCSSGPMADEDWIKDYRQRQEEKRQRQRA